MKDTDNKRYRLLKDLPDAKAGTILTLGGYDNTLYMYAGVMDDGQEASWYIPETVENSPEWFEEITEPKQQPLQEKITVNSLQLHDRYKGNGSDSFWYQVATSKSIDLVKYKSKIERAIESALNEGTVASYDGVYFKTKQGARLYTQKEVDEMISKAKNDTVVVWTDNLVADFIFDNRWVDTPYPYINKFKKSKKFSEKTDTVVEDKEYVTFERIKQLEKSGLYWMNKYNELQSEVDAIIKGRDALIEILQKENKSSTENYNELYKKVDAIREETWKAARNLSEQDYHHTPYKHRTLSDYIQSLTKDKEVDTGKPQYISFDKLELSQHEKIERAASFIGLYRHDHTMTNHRIAHSLLYPTSTMNAYQQPTPEKSDTGNDSKEWQICAVRDKNGKLWYTDIMPIEDGHTIDTVKRMSDNVYFSVGDKVEWGSLSALPSDSLAETKQGIIQEFKFNIHNDLWACGKDFGLTISTLSKPKT